MIVADLVQDDWFDVMLLVLIALVAVVMVLLAFAARRAWRAASDYLTTLESDVRELKRKDLNGD